MEQRVLSWDGKPLDMGVLGEKPYKLMVLKQAGLPVPNFATIISDGSGRIYIDDAVRIAYDRLEKPLIGRSAHPMEGGGFSFSGRFQSVERVTRLVDSPQDNVNYVDPHERRGDFPQDAKIWDIADAWYETRTFGLERAYTDIVAFANPNGDTIHSRRVKEYLEAHKITGFDPNAMNLLLMEQRAVNVFGMFLTSDQARPDEMVIHFQDRRAGKGDWIVYEKGTQKLKGQVGGELERVLLEFGRLATSTERQFGKTQQVEIGYSDRGVEIFQSRDINLKDASSVPRFAHYKTLTTGLHSNGMGYFHLPVLVIDALDSIHSEHFTDQDERRFTEAINPYREQVRKFVAEHPEFMAVIKDGEIFTGYYFSLAEHVKTKRERYEELNAITRKAKVVFRGKCQNAIRHEDWDLIETGGINIWMGERERLANLFIHNQIVGEFAKRKARDYSSGIEENYVAPNVTLINSREPIQTGDYLHVLANTDGTFVWQD